MDYHICFCRWAPLDPCTPEHCALSTSLFGTHSISPTNVYCQSNNISFFENCCIQARWPLFLKNQHPQHFSFWQSWVGGGGAVRKFKEKRSWWIVFWIFCHQDLKSSQSCFGPQFVSFFFFLQRCIHTLLNTIFTCSLACILLFRSLSSSCFIVIILSIWSVFHILDPACSMMPLLTVILISLISEFPLWLSGLRTWHTKKNKNKK